MTDRLIRTLVCTALLFMTSQAWAQSDFSRFDYSLGTSLGAQNETALSLNLDSAYSDRTFMRAMTRMIRVFTAESSLSQPALTADSFPRSDPEFGLPDAFRRPRQARLSFHIRFR